MNDGLNEVVSVNADEGENENADGGENENADEGENEDADGGENENAESWGEKPRSQQWGSEWLQMSDVLSAVS